MNKFFLVLLSGCFCCYNLFAKEFPTVVYGEANTADGGKNVFVVEQPKDAPNPLGDPLPNPDMPVEVFGDVYPQNNDSNQTSTQPDNMEQSQQQSLKNLGDDFENTLLEANGRVYDIQSYPKADFKAMENPADPKTIYSPNVNN